MIVQHHSEATKRPSITALTMMWADQNMSRMLVSGGAAAAMSAGLIGAGDLLLAAEPRTMAARDKESAGVCAANRPKLGILAAAVKSRNFLARFKSLMRLTGGYRGSAGRSRASRRLTSRAGFSQPA